MEKETVLAAAQKLLDDPSQLFILSTLTEDGYPDSRLMGNICEKTLKEVYFTCRTGTRKINQIKQNAMASVYFNKDNETVWLYGKATVTTEESIRRKIWNDRMLSIYPNGAESPNLVVIRFVPEKLRYRKNPEDYLELKL